MDLVLLAEGSGTHSREAGKGGNRASGITRDVRMDFRSGRINKIHRLEDGQLKQEN